MRILATIFGGENKSVRERVFKSLRTHRFDQIILFKEKGLESLDEYKQFHELQRFNVNPIEEHEIDRKDFWGCYNLIQIEAIEKHKDDEVIFDISAGHKLPSMAMLFCAYMHGIQTYHIEAGIKTQMPVYEGLKLTDQVEPGEIELLKKLEPGTAWKTLKEELESSPKGTKKDFQKLRNKGLVDLKGKGAELKLEFNEIGSLLKRHFERLE